MKKDLYNLSIYLFTRDLRLYDNTGLIQALKKSINVLPIFIFNPKQLDNNPYKSDNCVKFMCECLDNLNQQLKKKKSRLFYFYGEPIDILSKLVKTYNVNCIFFNKDYSPFAIKREHDISKICAVETFHDYLLTNDTVVKPDGHIYVKFTPFYNKAKKIKVALPAKNGYSNYISNKHHFNHEYTNDIHKFYTVNKNYQPYINGTKVILKNIPNYIKIHNSPSIDTTHLSAFLKFGVVSIRHAWHTFNKDLQRQLYWRDFYMLIMLHNPHVIGHNMKLNFNPHWKTHSKFLKNWKNGTTGFPLVDAGMRQLNTTGWMHNRVRMVVADFLVKLLHIDWRIGEKYFATHLIDYDIALNNGNWQWQAGSGVDSQPYFRIFNPWRQSERFDKDCLYIKKWIPELLNVPPKDIHIWYDTHKNYNVYKAPVIDYVKEKSIALKY